jgi:hypothetical protein
VWSHPVSVGILAVVAIAAMVTITIGIRMILQSAEKSSGREGVRILFITPIFRVLLEPFEKSRSEKREMQEIQELLILIKDEMALRRIMDSARDLTSALPRKLRSPFRERLARVDIVGTPREIASQLLPLIADLVHAAEQRGISAPRSLVKMANANRLPAISQRELL